MPTIICHECLKPWMDTKHRVCPFCGAEPLDEGDPRREAAISAAAGGRRDDDGTAITREQAARIITLLEQQTGGRIPVREKATQAHEVLALMASVTLGLGLLVAVVGFFSMFPEHFVSAVITLASSLAGTTIGWGLLTAASVVTGYVANRS